MAKFKAHLREGIDMLKRGQAIHTRVGGRGAAAAKKKPGADKKSYTGRNKQTGCNQELWIVRCTALSELLGENMCKLYVSIQGRVPENFIILFIVMSAFIMLPTMFQVFT